MLGKKKKLDLKAIRLAKEKRERRRLKRLGLKKPEKVLRSVGLVDDADYGPKLQSDPDVLATIRERVLKILNG